MLKNKQLLINLGGLGVLFVNRFPMFEVSIVALGEDVSKEFYLTSAEVAVPKKEPKPKRKVLPINNDIKESKKKGLFEGLI